jgi:hypothetical protein
MSMFRVRACRVQATEPESERSRRIPTRFHRQSHWLAVRAAWTLATSAVWHETRACSGVIAVQTDDAVRKQAQRLTAVDARPAVLSAVRVVSGGYYASVRAHCVSAVCLPAYLRAWVLCRGLYMYQNLFSGSIPSTLGGMHNLVYVYLGSNALSGDIPPALFDAAFMMVLDLSNNNLTSSIPSSIAAASQLRSAMQAT